LWIENLRCRGSDDGGRKCETARSTRSRSLSLPDPQLGVTILADTVQVRALHKNDAATIYISKLDMHDQSQFADNSLGMSGGSFQITTMN